MRQCVHHMAYVNGGQVNCDLHGVGPLKRCQGCPDFSRVSRGLGDTLAKVTAAAGVTPERIERLTGRPCNCPGRIQTINRLVPYGTNHDDAND